MQQMCPTTYSTLDNSHLNIYRTDVWKSEL